MLINGRSIVLFSMLAISLVATLQVEAIADAELPIIKRRSLSGVPYNDVCGYEFDKIESWINVEAVVVGSKTCSQRHYNIVAIQGGLYLVDTNLLRLMPSESALVNYFAKQPNAREIALEYSRKRVAELAEEASRAEAEAAKAKAEADVKKQAALSAFARELATKKKHGLALASVEIEEHEYVDATAFKVRVVNPTDKVIKYLTFSVVGYNAVGDPVLDRLKGKSRLEVRGIGPIKPSSTGFYEWKYMWHTRIVDSFKIHEIKIEYMDKSVKVIKNSKELMFDKEVLANLPEGN